MVLCSIHLGDPKLRELEKLADACERKPVGRAFQQSGCSSYVSKLLVSKVAPDWLACFTLAEQSNVFDGFFLSLSPGEAISDLVPELADTLKPEDDGSSTVVRLQVERLLVEVLVRHLGIQRLAEDVTGAHRSHVSQLAQLVSSIPDRARSRTSAALRSPKFIASVVAQVSSAISSSTVNYTFVAELLGKLCRRGHADAVASELLSHLACIIESAPDNSKLESDGWSSVIISMEDSHAVEKLSEAVLLEMEKRRLADIEAFNVLRTLYGDPGNARETIRAMFTNKFLLSKSFRFPVLKWTLDFFVFCQAQACNSGPRRGSLVRKDVVKTIAEAWAERTYIQVATGEQQAYLTAALGICLSGMEKEDVSNTDNLLRCLLDGISRRLESPILQVRKAAKQIALAFSMVLTPEKPLLLDDEDRIEELSKWDVPGDDSETPISVVSPQESKASTRKTRRLQVDPDAIADLANLDLQDGEDESESEGSLEPYDMSDDELDLDKAKYPSQLKDCASNLRKDDAETVERALEACERLIRFIPDELVYNAPDLAQALVYVKCSSFSVEGQEATAEARRHAALVALLVCSPLPTAAVLTKELYSAHLDVSQRLLILEVLSDAARELASGVTPTTSRITVPNAGPWKEVSRPASGNSSISWCQTFERELPAKAGQKQLGKSRRWGNRSLELQKQRWEPNTSKNNKFAPVAAAFMLPVMRNYDQRSHGVDFLGSGFLVLGRLIHMLGVCMECVAFHAEAAPLGANLLDMLRARAISAHAEPYVRREVLFALSRILVALHPSQAVNGMAQAEVSLGQGLSWIREWAARVAENDPDEDCSKMAIACLRFHSELAFEASRSIQGPRSSPLILPV